MVQGLTEQSDDQGAENDEPNQSSRVEIEKNDDGDSFFKVSERRASARCSVLQPHGPDPDERPNDPLENIVIPSFLIL